MKSKGKERLSGENRMKLSAKSTFRPRGDLGRFVEAHVTPAVAASVRASCALIEQSAKLFAPVDTGRLRDSIQTNIDDTGKTVVGTVGTEVPYAAFQEFGTRFQSGTPFLRPAIDEHRAAIKDIFRDQLSLGIKA